MNSPFSPDNEKISEDISHFYCYLTGVLNSAVQYNKTVNYNSAYAIQGRLNHLSILVDGIPESITKINGRIDNLTLGGANDLLRQKSRIKKNITHLDQRLEKACSMVGGMCLPVASAGLTDNSIENINEFLEKKNKFTQFVRATVTSAPPPYDPPPDYAEVCKKGLMNLFKRGDVT